MERRSVALQGTCTIISTLLLKYTPDRCVGWCNSVPLRVQALSCAERSLRTLSRWHGRKSRQICPCLWQSSWDTYRFAELGSISAVDKGNITTWAQQNEKHNGRGRQNPGWRCWTFCYQMQNPSYVLVSGMSTMTICIVLITSCLYKDPRVQDYCVDRIFVELFMESLLVFKHVFYRW